MSSGVMVTLLLNLKPEARDAFCGNLPEMLKDTVKFAGFRNVRVVGHKTDPNQVIFVEEWDSEEAYNKYIAWRTERGDMDAMASALATPPKMDFWTVKIV